MERAVTILRPDLDPVLNQLEFQAAVDELNASFSAESVSGSTTIELTVVADGETLAQQRLNAILDAYRAFLDEEIDAGLDFEHLFAAHVTTMRSRTRPLQPDGSRTVEVKR